MSYADLLRDPRWQRKRLEILGRDNFKCRYCYDATSTLHAHHTRYEKGALPWDYNDDVIITLCESCHERWHEDKLALDNAYAYLTPENQELLMGYLRELLLEQFTEARESSHAD